MRTIIAGSRIATKFSYILKAIDQAPWTPSVVLSGRARGADELGEKWATRTNIPVEWFPADWNKFGKGAGYIRNAEMANKAEALIVLWDGESKGTKNMIDLAKIKGLKVFIYRI